MHHTIARFSTSVYELSDQGSPGRFSAIDPRTGRIETATFTSPKDAKPWIAARDGRKNLYYSVNPPRTDSRPDKKAKKHEISHLAWLHVDVDVDPLTPDSLDAALDRLRAFDPPPTIIIFSGGGFNALWKLADPVPVTPDNVDELESYNRGLIAPLDGDPACYNIDRILRVPETWNLPTRKKLKAGRVKVRSGLIDLYPDRLYRLDQFRRASGAAGGQSLDSPGVLAPPLSKVLPVIDLGELPVDQSWQVIIHLGHDPTNPGRWASRSEAVFAVVRVLIKAGCSNDVIGSVLLDPDFGISESCIEKRSRRAARAYVSRQIWRARNYRRSSNG